MLRMLLRYAAKNAKLPLVCASPRHFVIILALNRKMNDEHTTDESLLLLSTSTQKGHNKRKINTITKKSVSQSRRRVLLVVGVFKCLSWYLLLASTKVGSSSRVPSAVAAATNNKSITTSLVQNDARIALAGGIAGATGTAMLYPIDAAKTLRQTDPRKYTSIVAALRDLFFPTLHQHRFQPSYAYRGAASSILASIPSSAVYFGAYETVKNALLHQVQSYYESTNHHRSSNNHTNGHAIPPLVRICIHGVAAVCGNAASSLIFVPKEYVKQQLQAYGSPGRLTHPSIDGNKESAMWCSTAACVISETLKRDGIRGLYSGYRATLLRNIPTAALRFALYEEIKLRLHDAHGNHSVPSSPIGFVSGALAGAIASGLMTPIDVLKTRFATGAIPNHLGLLKGFQLIYNQHGWTGLYAGAGARMLWSGAFSAIGFGTFEMAKQLLGVANQDASTMMNRGKICNDNYHGTATLRLPSTIRKVYSTQNSLVQKQKVIIPHPHPKAENNFCRQSSGKR